MEVNTLFSAADALQSIFQSNPKSKQNTCSAPRVLTTTLKKLSYSRGAIYIPYGKEGRLACVTKLDGGKLSKKWLGVIKVKLQNNMRKGMSKEKAFYKAIVDALREGKFKYYKHYTPAASVVLPSDFLRVKIGDCSELATLIAATAKAFNLEYIYIYNSHHIFSAIVIKGGDKKPTDLKALKIEVSDMVGAPPATLHIYPIDLSPAQNSVSPIPVVGDLGKALSGARKWIQARDYKTKLKFVNSSGKILKYRSQQEKQPRRYVYPTFPIGIIPRVKFDMPSLSVPPVRREGAPLKVTFDLPPSLTGAESWITPAMRMFLWRHGLGPNIKSYDFSKK